MSNVSLDSSDFDEFKQSLLPFCNSIDADVIVYSGAIYPPSDRILIDAVKERRSRENALLFLATPGGSADSAFRIARCLSREYSRFSLFVNSICKSAGTLVSLAATEIIMSDGAELGPLDVQLSKPDELAEWTSGLTPIQSLSTLRQQSFESFEEFFLKLRYRSGLTITTKTALEIAAKLVIGLYEPVFAQLDPMRLGEIQRAMAIALHYGQRLAGRNLRDGALQKLIADYPSHGFIIDRSEASELFHNVRPPLQTEGALARMISGLLEAGVNEDGAIVEFISSSPTKPAEKTVKRGTQNAPNQAIGPRKGRQKKRTRGTSTAGASQSKSVRPTKANNRSEPATRITAFQAEDNRDGKTGKII